MSVAMRRSVLLGLALSLPAFASPVALAQGGIAGAAARASGAVAPSGSVSLDNLVIKPDATATITVAHVEATNTNLTKDELAKLFSEKTSREDAAAILAKMKADKLTIPSVVTNNKGTVLTLRGFEATGINEGKVEGAALAGIDGTLADDNGQRGTLKSGPLSVQGLNLAGALAALRARDMSAGTGLQIGHITWSGFEAAVPATDVPATAEGGNLYKASLGSLDAQGTYDGNLPVKAFGAIKSLVIEPPPTSSMGQGLAILGYTKLDLGLTFSGAYDKAAKSYSLDDYTITGANAGALTLTGKVGNIDPSVFTATQQQKTAAIMNTTVTTLVLGYKDSGLFDKAVAFFAAQQDKQPADVKAEWTAIVTQYVPLLMGGSPASLTIVDAATKFIATPKNLVLSVKAKGAPLKVSDLAGISDPMALLAKVDISATSGQ